jgi:hypothetical protein
MHTKIRGWIMLLPLLGLACAPTIPSHSSAPTLPLPPRSDTAPSGTDFLTLTTNGDLPTRHAQAAAQILAGNVPPALRELVPVTLRHEKLGEAVIWVTADVLSIGADGAAIRCPLGGPDAIHVARQLQCWLPTQRIVDAIYQQATRKLSPQPMPPTAQMTGNPYYIEHHRRIEEQLNSTQAASPLASMLTAGHKKDVVLTPRLLERQGRVAIYGWHELDGVPIQSLSTVHAADYADYSHGVRLVWDQVQVNGESFSMAQILADPGRASLLSDEGAFDPETLIQGWLSLPIE